MSTINEVIERVGRVKPNAISDEQKAAVLLELDGKLYRDVLLKSKRTPGDRVKGKTVTVCPECEGTAVYWEPMLDVCFCGDCGWSELPQPPRAYPEDGDKPLVVAPPYEILYDLYLTMWIEYWMQETMNYNNTAALYAAKLKEYQSAYRREHMPLPGPPVKVWR